MSDSATNENLREGRGVRGDFGKDQGVGMKKGWQTKTIGDVCDLATGGTPSRAKPEYFGGDIKWLVSGDINQGEIFDCEGRITEAGKKNSNAKLLPINSVMIALNGQGKTRGTVALLRTQATCNQSMVCISPKPSSGLLPEFLYANLHGRYEEIRRMTSDDDKDRRGLNMGLVRSIKIPIAPLAEQQRIVGLLDEAFEGLATAKANAEKNLQNARALFESHLQSVFTQRGPGWVETTLDKISTNLDSKRVPITKNVRTSGEYPYYGASGIVDYVGDYIFEGANLLVSEDGANLLARSTPIAFSVSGKYWVNNHAHILKFENMATQRFVEFYLESIKLDDYITGAAQPKLNQKALNSIPIPIPKSVETQAKIVESLESLQEQTQRLARLYEKKLATLEALKKSLLHQAFTGEL